jgi:hypothetical protein
MLQRRRSSPSAAAAEAMMDMPHTEYVGDPQDTRKLAEKIENW